MSEPRWLSLENVIRLHSLQITSFGGSDGIRDHGLLESAVLRPQQRHYYGELRTIVEVAVAYAVALNSNHAFIDGNKRVAFHALLTFLRLHGLQLQASPDEATKIMLALAAGEASEEEVQVWVEKHL